MNYIDCLAEAIAARCAEVDTGPDIRLYRLYALLALTVGADVTNEHVHDAWSVWMADDEPNHRSLTPFDRLSPEVQEMDTPFRDAIRAEVEALAVYRDAAARGYSDHEAREMAWPG